MKTTKMILNSGASMDVLAERDAADAMPIFPSDGSDTAEADERQVEDAAQVIASSSDLLTGDEENRSIIYANRGRAIAARMALAKSPERIRLIDKLQKVHDCDGVLPRSGHKYHVRAVLDLAGVTYGDWLAQSALRADLNQLAPLFRIEDAQTSVHVRGGSSVESLLSVGRRAMDQLELDGIAVLRESANSPRISINWFADYIGMPREVVAASSGLKNELRERLRVGRLKMGGAFEDLGKPTTAQRRAARNALTTILLDHETAGRPIPSCSERANRIDIDWLLDEAGIVDPRLRDCMKRDQTFRHDLAETIRKVRMKPVHLSRIDPSVVSYARLEEEGAPLLRQIYRADTPNPELESEAEGGWVRNHFSFLRRYAKTNQRAPADDAAADFHAEGFEVSVALGHTSSAKGNAAYTQAMARWKSIVESIAGATAFPASFAGALDAGMVATGLNAGEISRALGCNTRLIHNWRHGRSNPTFQNVHLVDGLERLLKMVPGTLAKRLTSVRSSRTMTGGRKEIELGDGTVVPLAGLWRYMDPTAPMWPEERLRAHVEETHKRVYGAETAHRVRQRAALNNAYDLPEPDPSSPIWSEMDDLVKFQTGLLDDGRLRNPKSEWGSDNTARLHRTQISIFVRFLMLSAEKGGIGLPPEVISFSLILNYRLVIRYIAWRVLRAAHLEVDGEAIGPKVTATEKQLLTFFANLMEPAYGWLTQSQDRVQALSVIDTTFRAPFIRAGKEGVDVILDETCDVLSVMPAAIVDAAVTEAGWREVAAKASLHLRSVQSRFQRSFKLIRDPQQLVMPILRHQHPIAVGLRMVGDSLKHARSIETSPKLHAKDYQQALAFLLLMLVVFRSGTMRDLTWRADGTGNVRRVGEEFEIVVGADTFKNMYNTDLFGPSWNRRDYERDLGDWGDFNRIMDHYLRKCRPLLLDGRESDLLFPPPKGRVDWSEHNFNYLIMAFTRKWCLYNPRYGTGMKGVQAFGPHPARNIVATHILRNHPTEDRWRLASIVLQTGVDKVKMNYGWVTTREELAKTDYLFKGASDLAASNADLY